MGDRKPQMTTLIRSAASEKFLDLTLAAAIKFERGLEAICLDILLNGCKTNPLEFARRVLTTRSLIAQMYDKDCALRFDRYITSRQ